MKLLKLLFANAFLFVVFLSLAVFLLSAGFHVFEQFFVLDYSAQSVQGPEKKDPVKTKGDEVLFPLIAKNNGAYLAGNSEHFEESKDSAGNIEYSVVHSFSPVGSRKDIIQTKADLHYIAMGDSQTFGHGVPDEKVYSNIIASKRDDFRTYNMGFMAWGPAATYMFFDDDVADIRSYIKQDKGVMTWLYFPHLSQRDVGAPDSFTFTSAQLPSYELENGELVLKGKLKEVFSHSLGRLAAFFGHHQLLEGLKKKWSKKANKEMYAFTAKVFKQMEKQYLKKFPGSDFYILICSPFGNNDQAPNHAFAEEGLKVFDLRDKDICSNENSYFSDSHMRPSTHRRLADFILKKVIYD